MLADAFSRSGFVCCLDVMKTKTYLMMTGALVALGTAGWMVAQDMPEHGGQVPPVTSMQSGYHFLSTRVYSAAEDQRILELFQGLRTTDVSDGLDSVGLPNAGTLDPDIAPLWIDAENYAHCFVGFAVTARFVPSQEPRKIRTESEFEYFAANWYQNRAPDHFQHLLRPGSVLVIDDDSNKDVGTVSASSVLNWKTRGCVGVVTNGGVRDSDEIMTQKTPVYYKKAGRGIRAGRVELESVNRPVVVGEVCVMPGDVIVADGDGVVLVPRVHAERVARYAQRIRHHDREDRAQLYDQLAMPQDISFRK